MESRKIRERGEIEKATIDLAYNKLFGTSNIADKWELFTKSYCDLKCL